jgi:hypothetical protein
MFIVQIKRTICIDPSQFLLVSATANDEPKQKTSRRQKVDESNWIVCRLIGSLPTPEIHEAVKQLLPDNAVQVGLSVLRCLSNFLER